MRTAAQLRWQQIVYRPLRMMQRSLPLPPPRAAALENERIAALADEIPHFFAAELPERVGRADEVLSGRFTFLNHTEQLSQIDWRRHYVSDLWTYNLHYFEFAVDLAVAFRSRGEARYAARFEELLEEWLATPFSARDVAWAPYPLSLRLVNWTYAFLLLGDALSPKTRERLVTAIHHGMTFLERRIEHHIQANHLQKNLHALFVASLLFSGRDAARINRHALRRLVHEIDEQVLDDGGHFERSPMYHAIALRDFLEVMCLLRAVESVPPQAAAQRVRQMVTAFGMLSRPDGRLHLFNDCANGIAASRVALASLAGRAVQAQPWLQEGIFALPQTGFYGWVGAHDRFIIDCGKPAPRHQGGHAHCDVLSFELDVDGYPLIVDTGTSGYDGDPLRAHSRSTSAHNTVRIGDREQSEVWGTFRLARHARVHKAKHRGDAQGFEFTGSCSPYHDRNIEHARTVAGRVGEWRITDRVSGALRGAQVRSWLHIHPDWVVELSGARARVTCAGSVVEITAHGGTVRLVRGELDPPLGWYCPEFGMRQPAPVLELNVEPGTTEFGWAIAVQLRSNTAR